MLCTTLYILTSFSSFHPFFGFDIAFLIGFLIDGLQDFGQKSL